MLGKIFWRLLLREARRSDRSCLTQTNTANRMAAPCGAGKKGDRRQGVAAALDGDRSEDCQGQQARQRKQSAATVEDGVSSMAAA